MIRFAFLFAACLISVHVHAGDPPAILIAASNHQTASSLPPMPRGVSVVVLIQDADDDYAVVNARALAMRRATHFVSDRNDRSPLARLFRERLIGLGVIPIEIQKPRHQPVGLAGMNGHVASQDLSFANQFLDQ